MQRVVKVRVRNSRAEPKSRILDLQARTEVKQPVTVQAETAGQVIARHVAEGESVRKNSPLCSLAVNDRDRAVTAARTAVELAEIRHVASLQLRKKDYEQETNLKAAESQLNTARLNLALAEKSLADTTIRAPFAGYIEQVHTNVGALLAPGSPCATILDLDPLFVVTHITEQFVDQVTLGVEAMATLATGQTVSGIVSFIGKQASERSRTFRTEIRVENPDYQLRAGVTADVQLALASVPAHQVSPAMLVLQPDGDLGVYSVDDSRVRFHEINIVAEDPGGIWISGPPDQAMLITVGQNLVKTGDQVSTQLDVN